MDCSTASRTESISFEFKEGLTAGLTVGFWKYVIAHLGGRFSLIREGFYELFPNEHDTSSLLSVDYSKLIFNIESMTDIDCRWVSLLPDGSKGFFDFLLYPAQWDVLQQR